MRPGQRFGFSAIEKRDVWSRWKAGQSLHEIGRALDKPPSCIRSVLLPRGGIPPAARRRSRLALTLAEREDISRGIASDWPLREIARRLDRAASTLSREISRHGGRPAYRALDADRRAWDSALRPKQCLLALHPRLREIVASKLILDWSPEQISGLAAPRTATLQPSGYSTFLGCAFVYWATVTPFGMTTTLATHSCLRSCQTRFSRNSHSPNNRTSLRGDIATF
jgi:IS30 family transposase